MGYLFHDREQCSKMVRICWKVIIAIVQKMVIDKKGQILHQHYFNTSLRPLQTVFTLNVPFFLFENLGKTKLPFPPGPVIKCFVIPPSSKVEKMRRIRLLHASWLTSFSRSQEARPNRVQVESFDPQHVTRFPPIGILSWEV